MEKLRAGMVWAVALGALGTLGTLSGGCASTGAVPKPFPSPGSRPRAEAPADDATAAEPGRSLPPDTYALVGTALDLRGVRYRNGGADPGGFDCSGFTQYVFARHGVKLPRSVRDQFDKGTSVRPEDVREGDLLFFSIDGPGASHVAIAVGGDSFVHAPSSSGVVRVERLASRYWANRFVGARRIP
jgi:peptidoglycan DL-endopeptidase CwlO